MGAGAGGGGNGGRKGAGGGGAGTNGDAGQPGEVVRAAEEAKLQARVDNMNQLMGKLDKSIKSKVEGVRNLERELSKYSERDRSTKEIRKALEKNIKTGNRKISIDNSRLQNINKRFEKILADNS